MEISQDVIAEVGARAVLRLAAVDPLLPQTADLPPGCGARFAARDSGQPVAVASCEYWEGEPGSIGLAWGAARRFRLVPSIAGPDVATALDSLVQQWRDHLADAHDTGGDDTATVVVWPSRDVDGIRVLLRHGMAPRAVVAARATRRDRAEQARSRAQPVGVVIRRARPTDIDVVSSLNMALVKYDDYFGAVVKRAETEDALRKASAELLAGLEPWTWLAERDGVAVGVLEALRPQACGWLTPLTRLAPVAYLQQGYVLPAERGSGVGTMLTATFHAELAKADVAVALLDYSQVNPLSAPFWSQQGYRPLWTTWEARPARTLR